MSDPTSHAEPPPAMHTLYGARGSGAAAVEMALRACGLPWRPVRAATWEPDSALDELRRVNPLQQIPTLVLPDGTVMTESAAILIHLALEVPAAELLPQAPGARAQALRALVFIAANCYAAIGIIDYPERWTTAATKPAQAKVRLGARRRLHHSWDVFADIVGPTGGDDRPYLSGRHIGALDFLAVVVSRWSGARAHLATSRPQLLQTLQRAEMHEWVAPVVQAHWDK